MVASPLVMNYIGFGAMSNGGGASNVYENDQFDVNAGFEVASITAAATTGTLGETLNGLHNIRVAFDASYNGAPVVVHGPGRDGEDTSETFTYAGPGAQAIDGEVAFAGVSSVTSEGGGSVGKVASVRYGKKICTANAPITAVIAVFGGGNNLTGNVTNTDLDAGTFEIGSDPTAGPYYVLYSV